MTSAADHDTAKPSNFLRHVIENDLEQGQYATRRWGGSPGDAAHHAQGMQDPAKVRSGGATDHATFDLLLDKLTGRQTINVKTKWLTFSQLVAEWRRFNQPDPALTPAERAAKQMRIQVIIHEKFATAFSVLSFALIAIPLGIKVSRKETSANLGLALALAMAYYFGTIVVGWVDGHPALRPDLLMWLPNLGFQALGLWMIYKVDRSSS